MVWSRLASNLVVNGQTSMAEDSAASTTSFIGTTGASTRSPRPPQGAHASGVERPSRLHCDNGLPGSARHAAHTSRSTTSRNRIAHISHVNNAGSRLRPSEAMHGSAHLLVRICLETRRRVPTAVQIASRVPTVGYHSRYTGGGSAPMPAVWPTDDQRSTDSRAMNCRRSWVSMRSALSAKRPTGAAKVPRSTTAMSRGLSEGSCVSDATRCSAMRRTIQHVSGVLLPTWPDDDLNRGL